MQKTRLMSVFYSGLRRWSRIGPGDSNNMTLQVRLELVKDGTLTATFLYQPDPLSRALPYPSSNCVYSRALFYIRTNQSLSHRSHCIRRYIHACTAVRSNAKDFEAEPFNTMATSFSAQPTLRSSKNQDPKIAEAIKNRMSPIGSQCPRKRKFAEFAKPLRRKYLPKLKREWAPTIGDFIAAGGDLTAVIQQKCQLTNNIHPILADGNLCVCPEMIKPSDDWLDDNVDCMAPHFADSANLKGLVKEQQPASILPKDNAIMRTILQLASRMIEDEGTLPFWAGILNAVTGEGEDAKIEFKVHPRRKFNQVRKERTLRFLREELNVRFHFKIARDANGDVDECACGCTGADIVRELDPCYDVYGNTEEGWCYGYRDGKPTLGKGARFPHVCLNIGQWRTLQPLETLRDMTVSEMQIDMFTHASTIFHELAHAFELDVVDRKRFSMPPLNDEVAQETGFTLEAFTFGGIPQTRYDIDEPIVLMQWPCQELCDMYDDGQHGGMQLTQPGDAGPERYIPVEPRKVEAFFLQSFWDDPNPPVGCWKKMWLRPAVFAALDPVDFAYYTTGDTRPFEPEAKRRKFSDATTERQRARKADERWKERTQSRFRWHRSKDIAEERKAEFHEREAERLGLLWAECMKGV
jgi:hypothetical protein